jgi:protein disulfide-isomerase
VAALAIAGGGVLVGCSEEDRPAPVASDQMPEPKAAQIATGEHESHDHGEVWTEDFENAKRTAREQGKPILLSFEGSDWCGWCMKLDREVFRTDEFKHYADEKLVAVKLDFPRTKPQADALRKQNRELARKYNIEGFPTVIVLNPDGQRIGRTGYVPGGPSAFIREVDRILTQ